MHGKCKGLAGVQVQLWDNPGIGRVADACVRGETWSGVGVGGVRDWQGSGADVGGGKDWQGSGDGMGGGRDWLGIRCTRGMCKGLPDR